MTPTHFKDDPINDGIGDGGSMVASGIAAGVIAPAIVATHAHLHQINIQGNKSCIFQFVGVLGVLQFHGISEDLKAELLRSMDGNASSFLDGEVPNLDHATAADQKSLQGLANSCAYWRKQLRASNTGLSGSVREVILEVGALYGGWMSRQNAADLVELCARILSDLNGTLSSRLKFVSTRTRDIGSVPLVLMTMHGSKGLEFETVHVIDASAADSDSHVANYEAERRLMYVALTRAKNRCVVWFSGKPHMTVTEARIPVKHRYDDVKALVLAGN